MTIESLVTGAYAKPWQVFMDLSAVPRPSKHEEKIREWLLSYAADHDWETATDATGNVVIRVPGRGALKDMPPLILQGHMDMVCEKNEGTEHDFMNDPIVPYVQDGWVTAGTTTLGADNGVAMAYGLALAQEPMDDRLPLEILITTDEETGLTGAMELDASLLTGKHVVNLDSEDEDEIIIGCAGGVDVTATFKTIPATYDGDAVILKISGMRGGHSGISIHENRGNAIRIMGSTLKQLRAAFPDLKILGMTGGNKRNAIPRECTVTLANCDAATVQDVAQATLSSVAEHEPNASADVSTQQGTWEGHFPSAIIDFVVDLPNGVLSMEPDYPDLVRTSSSLGVAKPGNGQVQFVICTRSSSETEKSDVVDQITDLGTALGGEVISSGSYPGWEPYAGAKLVARASEVFREVCGVDPVRKGIHAGLEAGIIGQALGTRELLAYGPQIENAHSPDERMKVASFERGYRFLKELVSRPVTGP